VDDWHVVAYRTGEQTVLGPFNPVKTDCLDCPSCEDCIKEAWYPWDQAFDPYDPDPDDPLVPFKPENDFVSTKPREALIELGRLDAVFELDGKEIQVLRTSVNKLFTDEEHESDIIKAKEACYERFNLTCDFRVKTYAFQWGKIYPPGELAVGVHTLRMVETYYAENGDEFIFSDSTLTFTVYEHDEACHGEPCEPL
jgi:hypothetical protein